MQQPKQLALDSGVLHSEERFSGTRLGWIDHLRGAVPWVDFEGNLGGPLPACGACVGMEALQAAASTRQQVVLVFDEKQPGPVVLSLVQPGPQPRQEPHPSLPTGTMTGRRVEITAQQKLEIRCGGAQITLDANGAIRIQGEKIETRATNTTRLQGDEIEIN